MARLLRAHYLVLLLLLFTTNCTGSPADPAAETPSATTVVDTPSSTLPPALMATATAPGETPGNGTPAAAQGPFASPEYGVQAFLWWRPDIAQRDLALVKAMGFDWVKQSFAWRDIEALEKGKTDWWKPDNIVAEAEANGIKLLARLDRQPYWAQAEPEPPLANAPPADLQDFGDFCGQIAARYRGRIPAYQVWNEPNLSREWGGEPPDPVAYTALLRTCYEAIKAADPEAIVISAGLAPTGTSTREAMPDTVFLQGMYDAGAAAYFDVLGLNAPGYKAPPELPPEEAADPEAGYGGGRWFAFRHVEDMRAIMEANGDAAKQVAILEMGWTLDEVHPDYAWFAVDAETQAAYLVRAYEYARENWQPWIGLMTTIYIADYEWTEENEQWWWSIVLPDGTKRPAYHALQEMEK